jgi:hypothetical protein
MDSICCRAFPTCRQVFSHLWLAELSTGTLPSKGRYMAPDTANERVVVFVRCENVSSLSLFVQDSEINLP